MNTAQCPDKETLFGYVVGTISENEAELVARHLDTCQECERTVQALEGLSDTMISALRQPAQGDAYAAEPECGQVLEELRVLQIGRPESVSRAAVASPPKKPRRTSILGDYELLKKLGQGGMGTVYKARHRHLKREVALKVLRKDSLKNEQTLARFAREMEAVGRLDHPHIVRAMDAREIDGIRFLVMEYVDGLDLSEIVHRCGPFSIPDACEAICQAARGLQCSQENGLVHRDIKPSNLMLSPEGQVKLLDLGLAHIQEAEMPAGEVTGIGQVMGTPDYMSPEQCLESHGVDIRTDVYSLGCTFYYLLAGQPPYSGPKYDTAIKKVTGHIRDAAPPIQGFRPDVPKPIAALIERMLAKDLDRRIGTPAEVVNMLAPFCEGSKLIRLLRKATANEQKDGDPTSHLETNPFQASAMVDTSRDELAPAGQRQPRASSDPFDPYHRWLGIPREEQPPNHYRLLGLARFEGDPEVIRDAAARQMAHVRTYHLGPHAALSQKILDALGAAQACLLNPQKKAAYDAELRPEPTATSGEEEKQPDLPPSPDAFPVLVEEAGPQVTLARTRFGMKKPPVPILVATGSAALLVLFGTIIYITTGKGSVKIVLSDPKANVELKIDGDAIELAGLDDPIRLRPGPHELVVTGKNYETVCQSFRVVRGANSIVEVTLAKDSLSNAGKTTPPVRRSPLAIEPSVARSIRLGYTIRRNPESAMEQIAPYTNIIMDHGWSAYGDNLIQAARRNHKEVVLAFYGKWQREEFERRGLDMVRKNRDVVSAVCWHNPDADGCDPSELSKFGNLLHQESPAIEFWCLFVARQREPWRSHDIPQEVDAILIDCSGIITPEKAENLSDQVFPQWIKRTAGRPVYFYWTCFAMNAPGIVPDCQTGTLASCARVIEKHDLAGLIIDNYGSELSIGTNVQPGDVVSRPELVHEALGRLVGLQSRPDLVAEVKSISEHWGISNLQNTLSASELAEGWKLLFDGKTLNGWRKLGGGATYEVDDECIVGRAGPGKNTFLCTEQNYRDFILKLDIQFDESLNSGIQFRSHVRNNGAVLGYQYEIDPRNRDQAGGIYDEGRRGWLAKPKDGDAVSQAFHTDGWNTIEIRAEGPAIKTWLNGVPCIDVVDNMDREGLIGLQIHAANEGQVRFRNIRLKDLSQTEDTVAPNKPPIRWLGYDPGSNPASCLSEIADHSNLILTSLLVGFDEQGVQAARRHGLKVVLWVGDRASMAEFLRDGTALAKKYPDTIVAVLSSVPTYHRINPGELAEFGRKVKQVVPNIQYWVSLADTANDTLTYELPEEVDVLAMQVMDCSTIDTVDHRSLVLWPKWVAKADKRPLVFCWASGERKQTGKGLVPRCEPGLLRAMAQSVDNLNMDGAIFWYYQDYIRKGYHFTGISSRPELVSEIKAIAKNWGVGQSAPSTTSKSTSAPPLRQGVSKERQIP